MALHRRRSFLAATAAALSTAGCLGAPGSPTETRRQGDGTDRSKMGTATSMGTDRSPTGTATPTATPTDARPTVDAVEGAWPAPGYDAAGTRYAPEVEGPAERPGVAWRTAVPGVAGVAVADGTVFAFGDGSLLALAATDGTRRWRTALVTGDAPVGPAYADGRVVVAAGNTVRAFDAADGSGRWSRPLPGGRVNDVVVAGGTVYAATGSREEEGVAAALDAASGEKRWQFDAGTVQAPVPILTEVAVAGDAVALVASSTESATYDVVLERTDGSQRWASLGQNHGRALTLADGRYYAGGFDGNVSAGDVETGETLWGDSLSVPVEDVAVDDERAYVSTEQFQGASLRAFDVADGTERWSVEASGHLAVADAVYVGSRDAVAAHDPTGGSTRWVKKRPESVATAGIAVVDGVIFDAAGDAVRALA